MENPSEQITASVIVPAYNAEGTLAECLTALQRQSISRSQYEIIVVDDGSTDNTANVARRFNVILAQQRNHGPASARNTGASSAASGRILLFTDADCVPRQDWIEKMLAPFEDPEIVAAKGSYLTVQREPVARLAQIEYEEKYERLAHQEYIDFVDTCSAAYRWDVFSSEGGFDTSFRAAAGEDLELSFRIAKHGHKIVLARDAIVYHKHPSTFLRYIKRKFNVGYWRVLVHWKYPGKVFGDSYTLQVQKVQMALAALIAVGLAGALWSSALGILTAISAIAFVVSTLAFVRRAAQIDASLAPYALPFILARSYGLLIGVAAGLVTLPLRMALHSASKEKEDAHSNPDHELTMRRPR